MIKIFFDIIITLRFTKRNVAKEKFYDAKTPIKIWCIDTDNIVISILVETKTNFEYLLG